MKPLWTPRWYFVLAAFLLCCGKGGLSTQDGEPGSAGGSSGSGGTLAAVATGGDVGKGGTIGTGGKVGTGGAAGGSGGATACTSIVCAADFPCSPTQTAPNCVDSDPHSMRSGATIGCAEVCGTPCCSGASCRMTTSACPTDTVCVYPTTVSTSGDSRAACVATSQTCGGALGNTCAATEYCEYLGVRCSDGSTNCMGIYNACDYVKHGAYGACKSLPSPSECSASAPTVCGCDGITYANDCARMAGKTTLARWGACS